MTDNEFHALCQDAFNQFVKLVPNPKTRYKAGGSTGNLALNAAKIEFPSPDVCLIYVDKNIAPYLPYTDKAWLSAQWNGKKNPNEGWIGRAAQYIVDYVAKKTQGEIDNNDTDKQTDKSN